MSVNKTQTLTKGRATNRVKARINNPAQRDGALNHLTRITGVFSFLFLIFAACTPLDGDLDSLKGEANEINRLYFTVSFETSGGDLIPATNVNNGETVNDPGKAVKDGYIFGGWYTDDTYTQAWDFQNTAVTDNITLYAKLDSAAEGSFTVMFFVDGICVEQKQVSGGGTTTAPALSNPGYHLDEWYNASSGGAVWTFASDTVNGNIRLYTAWIQDTGFTLEANGEGDAADTTEITFRFTAPVSGLTGGDLIIGKAGDSGVVTAGAMTAADAEGTVYTLAVTSVTTAGEVTVTIAKAGVDSAEHKLTVYKAAAIEP